MKDTADKKTIDFIGESKRRGRPPVGSTSMTAAQRKAYQRARQKQVLNTVDPSDWTKQECLMALSNPRWHGTTLAKGAWEQLGRLNNFM